MAALTSGTLRRMVRVSCVETSTGRSAVAPFWGWESTSNEIGAAYGLQPAVESIVSMSGPDWLYGPWSTFAPACSSPNMAFALFTTTNPGTINDANGTGVPDVCECIAPAPVIDEPSPIAKNRYLSFEPQAGGVNTAIRVTITSSTTFPGTVGNSYWVGPHDTTCSNCNGTPFVHASLQCTQHCQDWGGLGVIHAHGPEVVPDTTYEIEVIDCLCDPNDPLAFSPPLVLTNQKWGDLISPFGGAAQPNFGDITALVDTFKCSGLELPTVRAQLQPNAPVPCTNPNFADITADVDAFKGSLYPFAGPGSCPP